MTNNQLYKLLKVAYSETNLNLITAKIIELYKAKENDIIREIVSQVSEFHPIKEEKISKCFSQLIMLYHPDKGVTTRNEIDKTFASGNFDRLKGYSHILKIQDIDKIVVSKAYEIDEEFAPEYVWDEGASGYEYFTEEKQFTDSDTMDYGDSIVDNSFFSAVKRKFYGFMDIDLPSHYLEDFEDIEMAEFEIDDLDGVRFCKHVKELILSNNYISDLSELQHLKLLEELYLANNQIGIIDPLIACKNLKNIDLSNNSIDDISTLFELNKLEYVNLIGNPVPTHQIKKLKSRDVIVVF
jgi:Leucine-rich repeat (LRR) protein